MNQMLGERAFPPVHSFEQNVFLRQVHQGGVTHPEVLRALSAIPRHALVPEDVVEASYQDRPLPIGFGQTISQPTIVGLMTQWAIEGLDPIQRQRVLEVGTGSGYQAAVLAELFEEVFTIEVRPALAERARRALSALGPSAHGIECLTGDGAQGLPGAAPFDVIVVTAAAEEVPPALIEQLRPFGRLVMPIGPVGGEQKLHLFMRVYGRNDNRPKLQSLRSLPVRFVPLVAPESVFDA